MGGNGSGHWYRWDKRQIVEDCLALSIRFFLKNHFLKHNTLQTGGIIWNEESSLGQASTITYELCILPSLRPYLQVFYSIPKAHLPEENFDYRIPLSITYPNYGGQRWWFQCPLSTCQRRSLKLYLPPGGKYFGCRHCYNLAYVSQQESEPFRLLRRAEKICRKLESDDTTLRFNPLKPKGMWWRTYARLLEGGRDSYYQAVQSLF